MHIPLFIAHGDILLMLMLGGFAVMACVGVVIALVTSAAADSKEDRERFELKDPGPEPPKIQDKEA
jgi:hypothetical protein